MTLKLNGSTSGSVSIDAPASTTGGADVTLTLPVDDGDANQWLQTNGSGTLIWATPGNVKELIAYPCDGGTYSTINGNITAPNITDTYIPTASWVDVAGSVVSYNPPSGTTAVIYEFNITVGSKDAHGIAHFKAYIDDTEVVYSGHTLSGNTQLNQGYNYKLVIPIGGTADTNTGRQASWSSAKEIKLKTRVYSTNNEIRMYGAYYWDGSAGDRFRQPTVQLTAIG